MSEKLLVLQEVTVDRFTEPTGFFGLWGARPVRALDGVSLSVRRGETLGIMGGSGTGKTTLLETASLRRPCGRGRITLEGRDVTKLGGDGRRKVQRRLQLIRQDARESLEMERTVRKQFEEEMRQQGLPEAETRTARALAQVELPPELMDRTPSQLSGGQQQRVAIARALAMNPQLIAADEPVSGVDPRLQQELMRLLIQVQRERNLGYMVVSQDIRVIRKLAHRVAVMDGGRLLEVGPVERLLGGEARHPYSRLFFGPEEGLLPAEQHPAGKDRPGCPFATYCKPAIGRCRTETPVLQPLAEGHAVACHLL